MRVRDGDVVCLVPMNVLELISSDFFQMITEELPLPALLSLASTSKSHAWMPASAVLHARIAQLEEEELAAAEAREESLWFPNLTGEMDESTDESEDES